MNGENPIETYKRRDPATVKNKKLVKSNKWMNYYKDENGELLVEFKVNYTFDELVGSIVLDHEINAIELVRGRR